MIHHQEAWQVFSAQGGPLEGQSISPTESRQTSEVIVGAVHVWVWRRSESGDLELLLQKRAKNKPTWPGSLDISVAGHIDAGETQLEAIIREGDEEIGASFETDRIDYIFGYRNFENGLKWVYLYHEREEREYVFNDGEVESLLWVSLSAFKNMVADPSEHNLVPHPPEYFSLLLKSLNHLA